VIDAAVLLREERERTLRRVEVLTAEFDGIVDASDSANLDDEHDPEGATVGFERAQVSALLERACRQLDEIDAATERLRLAVYGMCEVCGARIPDARLTAQPAARRCVFCAAAKGPALVSRPR
jgi:DnaK suppressor protein